MSVNRLGPECLGERVVVRSIVRGETGPSGGPALTDVLGILISWSADTLAVRREDGKEITVLLVDVVSGKPVPPRPDRRR